MDKAPSAGENYKEKIKYLEEKIKFLENENKLQKDYIKSLNEQILLLKEKLHIKIENTSPINQKEILFISCLNIMLIIYIVLLF